MFGKSSPILRWQARLPTIAGKSHGAHWRNTLPSSLNPEKSDSTVLAAALRRMLRPLARVLLRGGLSYHFFTEVAKRVFVEVAKEEFTIPGRKPSDSRVALLTGLTRKEVLRLRRTSPEEDESLRTKFNRSARIIAAWTEDKRYRERSGKTAALPIEDNGETATIAELVRRYGADVPFRAVADELVRLGVVRQREDGKLELLRRGFVPSLGDEEKIDMLGRDVADLIETIDHNLVSEPDDAFVQRVVEYDNLPDDCLPELRRLSERQAQLLLERLDRWLRSRDRDRNPDSLGSGRNRAGVAVFYFEEHLGESDCDPH